MSRQDDIKKLLHNKNRRLQKLKELQALQGISVDPRILLEIEDIETEIEELQIQLEQIEAEAEATSQPQATDLRESQPQVKSPKVVGGIYQGLEEIVARESHVEPQAEAKGTSNGASVLLGRTLGHQYRIVDVIGQGSLATVYRAYQRSLERWVAIKVLHVHEKKTLARFKRQAKAVARLRHPNTLMVYGYDEEDGWPYIAMEYVEGGTLANYLKGKPLNWIKVVQLTMPIAEALHEAHGQGLIHRNVQPSNVLMRREDWPLLADFGLVKVKGPGESLTESDLVLGPPAYISPEQARGERLDHRADMYSLGIVMFEMITGRLPFEHKNPNLLMLDHITKPVPSPRELSPSCPRDLEKVILTATRKLPAERYFDMQALVDALADVLAASTASLPSIAPPSSGGDRPISGIPTSPTQTPSEQLPESDQSQAPVSRIFLLEKGATINLPDPSSEEDSLIIGRTHGESRADIDLGPHGAVEAGMSRQHACLFKQGHEWLIDDLGSLNGTYVNEERVTPGNPVPLKDGDIIRCSRLSFAFYS